MSIAPDSLEKPRARRPRELALNVAIAVAALALAAALAWKFALPGRAAAGPEPPAAGTRLEVPGVEWTGSGRTVVLGLNRRCPLCAESAPFYRRLAPEAAARGVRVLAVMREEPAAIEEYLRAAGIPVTAVAQAEVRTLGARAVPTVIVADGHGVIERAWSGLLDAEAESEVLASLRAGAPAR